MPHKRNPVVCERVSGLARVIRGHAQAALENVALWHERDISHSSAERIIFPDATSAARTSCSRDVTGVLDGLVVFPERMRGATSGRAAGSRSRQSVLLALVDAGHAARRGLPRSCSARRPPRGTRTRASATAIEADAEVRARLDDAALAELFDPRRFLRNLGGVFDRLEKLPVRRSLTR